MSLTQLLTVNEIINRAAAEVGVEPATDPYGSIDAKFVQMRYLLQTAGEELQEAYDWEFLTKPHQIITVAGQADYPLPDDFARMVNQTGWERRDNVPLGGPVTAQDWAYLKGRDLAANTLYVSFRIQEGVFRIHPDPPEGLDINFEYVSTHWVRDALDPTQSKDTITDGADAPLFHRTLITRYLKLKFLESAGFDTQKAQDDFNTIFNFLTGSDKGGGILTQGSNRSYPYIGYGNLPDTGFGH